MKPKERILYKSLSIAEEVINVSESWFSDKSDFCLHFCSIITKENVVLLGNFAICYKKWYYKQWWEKSATVTFLWTLCILLPCTCNRIHDLTKQWFCHIGTVSSSPNILPQT
jgi:hypothetical protein